MSVHWHSYPTSQEAAEACAKHIVTRLEEALSGEGDATLAVSGGSTPVAMFQHLTKAALDWSRVHVFQVDERAVPPTAPQSNFRVVDEWLIRPARIPRRNMHRIPAELRPEVAALRYAEDIREYFGLVAGEIPHLDVAHRGVGADSHTASLFPGEPLIDDREGIAAAVYVEKLGQWRITLLPGVLLAARHTVLLVTGGDKAGAVRATFQEPYDPKQFPAQMVSHHGRQVVWFLDHAAAALMD
jgi:6-phosphogluconolactonase